MPGANTYSVPGDTGGNREDLRNVLTVLEPEETPVVSTMKKGPGPNATFVEVLADTLDSVNRTGIPEGQDVTSFDNKATKRARFGNYIHISRRSFGVTDVQQLVDTAAVNSEYDYGKRKAVQELKRDIEAVVCGGQDRTSGDQDTPWATRGLFDWIDSAGPSDVPSSFRTPAAQIHNGATITEVVLNGMLQSLFETHGTKKSYLAVFSPELIELVDYFTRTEAAVANYTGASSATAGRFKVNDNNSSKTISMEVKTFNSSFGKLALTPSVFLNTDANGTFDDDAGLILDQSLLELQTMDDLHTIDMTDEGGGKRGYCKAIYSLCCKSPRGLGKLTAAD